MPVKYDKLFMLMESKGMNKHHLRKNGIHAAVVDKLIKGGTIETTTISKLCALLDCQPGDIMEYVSEEKIKFGKPVFRDIELEEQLSNLIDEAEGNT